MNNHHSSVPLHIWIGPRNELDQAVKEYVHTRFCKKHMEPCLIETHLRNRQFPAVQWISPERMYTRQTVETVFQTLSFALQAGEEYFFIFEQAHLIPSSVGNSLLKIFEEPPAGYSFILLCESTHQLLPTILSRGIITHFARHTNAHQHELYTFFGNSLYKNLLLFNKALDKSCPNENEIPFFLEQVRAFWITQLHTEPLPIKALRALDCIQKYSLITPMPGSAKFFLRALFLELNNFS